MATQVSPVHNRPAHVLTPAEQRAAYDQDGYLVVAIVISPSAVWIGFGRVPLREPVAATVRSYRARLRKAVTSSSTARCNTSRAPRRPNSARCSPSSLSPPLSNSSICASTRALSAILSIWRSPLLVVVSADLPCEATPSHFPAGRGRDLAR